MKYSLLLIVALMIIGSMPAHAGQLPSVTLSLTDEYHHVGDVVPLTVRLNSDGLNLNALDLTLNYSTIGLEVIRVDKALTNFPLWPEEPAWDNSSGRLHLSAGRPNGLVAVGATVATIYVKLQASGLWQFRVTDVSRGFINDGQGTPTVLISQPLDVPVVEFSPFGIQLSSSSHPMPSIWYANSKIEVSWTKSDRLKYSFSFSPDATVVPDVNPDETDGVQQYPDVSNGLWWFSVKSFNSTVGWSAVTRRLFLVDTTAPSNFTIEQLPTSAVGKKTVIAWLATDADSGLASYQLSVDGALVGSISSPLTVKDEWIGKNLTIRAVDGAGNSTATSWRDTRKASVWTFYLFIGVALVFVLLIGVGMMMVRRKRLS